VISEIYQLKARDLRFNLVCFTLYKTCKIVYKNRIETFLLKKFFDNFSFEKIIW
jgi:hypothetical protein